MHRISSKFKPLLQLAAVVLTYSTRKIFNSHWQYLPKYKIQFRISVRDACRVHGTAVRNTAVDPDDRDSKSPTAITRTFPRMLLQQSQGARFLCSAVPFTRPRARAWGKCACSSSTRTSSSRWPSSPSSSWCSSPSCSRRCGATAATTVSTASLATPSFGVPPSVFLCDVSIMIGVVRGWARLGSLSVDLESILDRHAEFWLNLPFACLPLEFCYPVACRGLCSLVYGLALVQFVSERVVKVAPLLSLIRICLHTYILI